MTIIGDLKRMTAHKYLLEMIQGKMKFEIPWVVLASIMLINYQD